MGKIVAFPGRLQAVAVGGESYPQSPIALYEEEERRNNEEEGGLSTPLFPQVDEKARLAELLEDMRLDLLAWHVWDARAILAHADPVAVAWAMTQTEEAINAGGVDNAGGLFRWFLRNGCNGL